MRAVKVDSAWAWLVAASVTLMTAVMAGLEHNYGTLFVALLDEFGKEEGVTSIPGSLITTVEYLTGLVIAPLGHFLGWPLTIFTGSLIAAVGLIITSFCKSLYIIAVTYGVITGFGFGLMYIGGTVRLQSYFQERRAMANGFVASGAGLGTLVYGFVLPIFLRKCGLQNTFRILAGFSLVGMVSSPLFRPVAEEIYKVEKTYGTIDTSDGPHEGDQIGLTCYNEIDLERERLETNDEPAPESQPSSCGRFCEAFRSGYTIYCNSCFIFVALAGSAYQFGENVTYTYLAEWAESKAIDESQAASFFAIIGGTSVGTRLIFGYFMDRSKLGRCVLCGLAIFLEGAMSLAIPLLDGYYLLVVYSVAFGLCAGVFWSIYFVCIVDFLGEDLKDDAIGQACACLGLATLISGPSAGGMIRWTGVLFSSIQLGGLIQVLGSAAFFTAAFISHRRTKSH